MKVFILLALSLTFAAYYFFSKRDVGKIKYTNEEVAEVLLKLSAYNSFDYFKTTYHLECSHTKGICWDFCRFMPGDAKKCEEIFVSEISGVTKAERCQTSNYESGVGPMKVGFMGDLYEDNERPEDYSLVDIRVIEKKIVWFNLFKLEENLDAEYLKAKLKEKLDGRISTIEVRNRYLERENERLDVLDFSQGRFYFSTTYMPKRTMVTFLADPALMESCKALLDKRLGEPRQ